MHSLPKILVHDVGEQWFACWQDGEQVLFAEVFETDDEDGFKKRVKTGAWHDAGVGVEMIKAINLGDAFNIARICREIADYMVKFFYELDNEDFFEEL